MKSKILLIIIALFAFMITTASIPTSVYDCPDTPVPTETLTPTETSTATPTEVIETETPYPTDPPELPTPEFPTPELATPESEDTLEVVVLMPVSGVNINIGTIVIASLLGLVLIIGIISIIH